MTKKLLYISLLALLLGAASCRKYVEVTQPNQRTFKYTSDFQALLNDVNVMETSASLPMLSSDDINIGTNTSMQNLLTNGYDNIYTWAATYYTSDQSDAGWDQLYNLVYVCNQITANVMTSTEGTDQQKKQVYAEAQVQRAATYLTLVNLYARVYNEANAASDPGLPLLLSPDLFVNLTRSSVKAVYDQIIKDLTDAIPNLPDVGANRLHPGKGGAYAVLARTYLYMQRYTDAADNAAKSLTYQHTLLNLDDYVTGGKAFPRRLDNVEVMMSKKAMKPGFIDLPLSTDLVKLFDTRDLRYVLFTRNGTSFFPAFDGRGSYRDRMFGGDNNTVTVGVGVPEMMLIQAEGLARSGDKDGALALINTLRQNRFKAADYAPLTAATADAVLHLVLEERRRELFGTGLRWFDQRRLSVEPALAVTVTRTFKGNTYTLTSGDRYVYPIPPRNIDLNPELIQNAR
ncbi:RagB/SusD family nutrient uptake outer membrane protein [Chitinophaga parva]|uniref:RagB/SusD family nutrient uptake outer membrane protein n=1 Tax=Chitinophaga parva TaxID=2169414 RepID=A0A2T7BIL2_9BACT|nr:RagB/SusD family nutrient uptake outer membrane protein [Chitinophaga parva]PUZ26129.1 RagB/SusD family nutrient uptake outer membrane protein [Chitinophaga parva]